MWRNSNLNWHRNYGFAKISAVEGIHLTEDMVADLEAFDRERLPPAERRRIIRTKYGKVYESEGSA